MASFSNLMQYLFELGKERSFSVIIDEFQEFYNINEAPVALRYRSLFLSAIVLHRGNTDELFILL